MFRTLINRTTHIKFHSHPFSLSKSSSTVLTLKKITWFLPLVLSEQMMYSIHTLHPEATVSCCPYLSDKPRCCWKSGMRREKESETALSDFYWFSGWHKARQVAFHWVGVSLEASRSLEPSPDYSASLTQGHFWLCNSKHGLKYQKHKFSYTGNIISEVFQNPLS